MSWALGEGYMDMDYGPKDTEAGNGTSPKQESCGF